MMFHNPNNQYLPDKLRQEHNVPIGIEILSIARFMTVRDNSGSFLPYSQSTISNTCMANLAPIVDSIDKPIVSFIKRRFQAFFDNRFFYYLLCLYRQLRIKANHIRSPKPSSFPPHPGNGKDSSQKKEAAFNISLSAPFQKLILPSHSIGITQNENAA